MYGLEATTILGVTISNTAYSVEAINIIYNLADLVNKTAFGVAIWIAAVKDTKDSERTFMI